MIRRHMIRRTAAALALVSAMPLLANIEPETVGNETMAPPGPTWLFARDGLGSMYIFDAADGRMHGLLSITPYTPAVEPNLERSEIYAAETYYTRGTRGDRTDVVTVYDLATLSPKAEIELPGQVAALPFRQYIALLDDDRHLAVFNMTPAQSVSIVDIQSRQFVTELSTPGCALNFPTAGRAFLQLCGDGRIQLIRLGRNGKETDRIRSEAFFDINDDPVFDKPIATPEGWLLASYGGNVFEVTVDGDDIRIAKPWSMLTEADREANWQPGGGQFWAYHAGHDLIYALMNDEGGFAHDSAGAEVWVFNRTGQRRVARLTMENKGAYLHVSQNDAALLTVSGEDRQLHVYDIRTLTEQRTIPEVGVSPGYLQGF